MFDAVLSCQLCKYEENYQGALDGFSRAAALEPSWTEPVMREEQLLDYLGRLCGLLSNKVSQFKPHHMLSPHPYHLLQVLI